MSRRIRATRLNDSLSVEAGVFLSIILPGGKILHRVTRPNQRRVLELGCAEPGRPSEFLAPEPLFICFNHDRRQFAGQIRARVPSHLLAMNTMDDYIPSDAEVVEGASQKRPGAVLAAHLISLVLWVALAMYDIHKNAAGNRVVPARVGAASGKLGVTR